MSRARPIVKPDGQTFWFDVHKNGQKATEEQVELLATVLQEDLDELLDGNVSQGDVLLKLREELGQGGIPPEVEERRKRWRRARLILPACRLCSKAGDSTKHHFVPKWMLRELEHYALRYADRRKCTIPVCITCHRDLHYRNGDPKSMAPHLSDEEKRFAQTALTAFVKEHPQVAWLVTLGDREVYEAQLMLDFIDGKFNDVSSQNGASG